MTGLDLIEVKQIAVKTHNKLQDFTWRVSPCCGYCGRVSADWTRWRRSGRNTCTCTAARPCASSSGGSNWPSEGRPFRKTCTNSGRGICWRRRLSTSYWMRSTLGDPVAGGSLRCCRTLGDDETRVQWPDGWAADKVSDAAAAAAGRTAGRAHLEKR